MSQPALVRRVEVSYSQIAVFDHSLQAPFPHWTERHVAQGFAWRPGCVAFGTIEGGGTHEVTIIVADHVGEPGPDAVRVIDVPFEVPPSGEVEIASIATFAGDVVAVIPPGGYLLRCEMSPEQDDVSPVRFTFARQDPPAFRIVRADDELSPEGDLLTTSEPEGC